MAPFPAQPKGLRRSQPRSASFHGQTATTPSEPRQMRRPKTQPELLSRLPSPATETKPKLPKKVLVNVTVQRSLGPVQVIASTEWTVDDLIAAAVRIYIEEERRPSLPSADSTVFGLHYSQFSLESLDAEERLINLGSRNFFICPKATSNSAIGGIRSSSGSSTAVASPWRCWKEVKESRISSIPWLRFMDFLL